MFSKSNTTYREKEKEKICGLNYVIQGFGDKQKVGKRARLPRPPLPYKSTAT